MFNLTELEYIRKNIDNEDIKNKISKNIDINSELVEDLKEEFKDNIISISKEPTKSIYYVYVWYSDDDSILDNIKLASKIRKKHGVKEIEVVEIEKDDKPYEYSGTINLFTV